MSLFPEHDQEQCWHVDDFQQWRQVARWLVAQGTNPNDVVWSTRGRQVDLLKPQRVDDLPVGKATTFELSRSLVEWWRVVAQHRDPQRWDLMYQALWRVRQGETHLAELVTDELVRRLNRMFRQVRRDSHKMKAFVRFKRVDRTGEPPTYVAWHAPDHNVLPLVADFFARRFSDMTWTIFTPYVSAHFDGTRVRQFEGVARSNVPDDELELLWGQYYRSTFNPARIKTRMMKSEMPVRYWKSMPETQWIPDMLSEAPGRVAEMIQRGQTLSHTAQSYLPENYRWESLDQALPSCRGCDLCDNGTRPVGGTGKRQASLMFVGEQPGDQEERQQQPFVGPAGQLLRQVLKELGSDLGQHYVTNAVKHFHHRATGERRLHKKPTARHVSACQPWLAAEIALLAPQVIVCLGATAMESVLGRSRKMRELRGEWVDCPAGIPTIVTWHPAAILRATSAQSIERRAQLKSDLQAALDRITDSALD